MKPNGALRIQYDPNNPNREKIMDAYLRVGYDWVDSCRVKKENGDFLCFWIFAPYNSKHVIKRIFVRRKVRDEDNDEAEIDSKSVKEPKPEIVRCCKSCPQKCKQIKVPHLTDFRCYQDVFTSARKHDIIRTRGK